MTLKPILKRSLTVLGVAALAIGAAQLPALAPAIADDHEAMAESPDAAIKYRKAVMDIIGANTTSLFQIAKGEIRASDATFAAHADMLSTAAEMTYDAFTQNTHGQGKEKTTAKEKVWTDWAKFEEGLDRLNDAALAVASNAADGNMELAKAGLEDLGKACKACHDDFRDK